MARIILPALLVGNQLLALNELIITAYQKAVRLQAIKNQIGDLESSPEARIPAGNGPAISAGIDQIVTSLTTLAGLLSVIDQG